DHAAQRGQVVAHLERLVANRRVPNQYDLGLGMAENVSRLVGAQREIYGNGTRANREDPDVGDVPFGTIPRPDGHVLLLRNLLAEQVRGPAPGCKAELRPRDSLVSITGLEVQRLGRPARGHLAVERLDDSGARGRCRPSVRRHLRGHGATRMPHARLVAWR